MYSFMPGFIHSTWCVSDSFVVLLLSVVQFFLLLSNTQLHVKKQQLETDLEQWTGSNLGKDYVKAKYCHLAYLTHAEYIMWNERLNEAQTGIKLQ